MCVYIYIYIYIYICVYICMCVCMYVNNRVCCNNFIPSLLGPGKRTREELEAGGSSEPQNKRSKEGKKAERSSSPPVHPHR